MSSGPGDLVFKSIKSIYFPANYFPTYDYIALIYQLLVP